jgi:hypothetical protein
LDVPNFVPANPNPAAKGIVPKKDPKPEEKKIGEGKVPKRVDFAIDEDSSEDDEDQEKKKKAEKNYEFTLPNKDKFKDKVWNQEIINVFMKSNWGQNDPNYKDNLEVA